MFSNNRVSPAPIANTILNSQNNNATVSAVEHNKLKIARAALFPQDYPNVLQELTLNYLPLVQLYRQKLNLKHLSLVQLHNENLLSEEEYHELLLSLTSYIKELLGEDTTVDLSKSFRDQYFFLYDVCAKTLEEDARSIYAGKIQADVEESATNLVHFCLMQPEAAFSLLNEKIGKKNKTHLNEVLIEYGVASQAYQFEHLLESAAQNDVEPSLMRKLLCSRVYPLSQTSNTYSTSMLLAAFYCKPETLYEMVKYMPNFVQSAYSYLHEMLEYSFNNKIAPRSIVLLIFERLFNAGCALEKILAANLKLMNAEKQAFSAVKQCSKLEFKALFKMVDNLNSEDAGSLSQLMLYYDKYINSNYFADGACSIKAGWSSCFFCANDNYSKNKIKFIEALQIKAGETLVMLKSGNHQLNFSTAAQQLLAHSMFDQAHVEHGVSSYSREAIDEEIQYDFTLDRIL